MTRSEPADGRWPVWKLALLLYPFSAGAVAINLFLLSLIGLAFGLPSLGPMMAIYGGALLGIPATLWAGSRLRKLMDKADVGS